MALNADRIRRMPVCALIGKYYMLMINVVFLLSGLLLLALGSYAVDKGISGFISSQQIAVGIIIIGIVFIIVAFVGFMGAIRESRRTMIAYLVFVTIFSIIEISIAIAAYARRDALPVVAQAAWSAAYNSESQSSKDTLHDLEQLFTCCGWADPTDMAVPENCVEIYAYPQGCENAIIETVESSLVTVGAVAAVFGTLQLLALIFACVAVKFFKPANPVENVDGYGEEDL